jgi:hypothetical protein
MNGSITPGTARDATVVMRQLGRSLTELIISAALLTAHFLIPVQHDLLRSLTGGAAIGYLVVVVLTARFRYEVRAGQVTAREQLRAPRSADLTRLTGVIAPDRPEKFWGPTLFGRKQWLELRDESGSVVRLSFFGTGRGPRRRLLAALKPYLMADGVSRSGLIREALDGQLWWPRPRPRRLLSSGSRRSDG